MAFLHLIRDAKEIGKRVVTENKPFMVSVSGADRHFNYEFVELFKTYREAKAFAARFEKQTGRIPYTSMAADVPEIKKEIFSFPISGSQMRWLAAQEDIVSQFIEDNSPKTASRQAIAGELVKIAKELIGCETCGCRDREAGISSPVDVGDYVMQAGYLDTLYGKVLDFADQAHREPIVIGIIAYGVGTPEMRISEGPTRIVCRGPEFRNVYKINPSEVPVKLRTLIDSRWDRSI